MVHFTHGCSPQFCCIYQSNYVSEVGMHRILILKDTVSGRLDI